MKMTIEQVGSTGEVVGQALTLEVVGGSGLSAYQIWLTQGNTGTEQDYLNSLASGGLPSAYTQAMDASEDPAADNPFMTNTATESSITTQRVDYDALVAATLSI